MVRFTRGGVNFKQTTVCAMIAVLTVVTTNGPIHYARVSCLSDENNNKLKKYPNPQKNVHNHPRRDIFVTNRNTRRKCRSHFTNSDNTYRAVGLKSVTKNSQEVYQAAVAPGEGWHQGSGLLEPGAWSQLRRPAHEGYTYTAGSAA